MKNFIKFIILIVILSILMFSKNTTIVKTRKVIITNGELMYNWCKTKLVENNDSTIMKIGKTI